MHVRASRVLLSRDVRAVALAFVFPGAAALVMANSLVACASLATRTAAGFTRGLPV
jgi:hypothetical protein